MKEHRANLSVKDAVTLAFVTATHLVTQLIQKDFRNQALSYEVDADYIGSKSNSVSWTSWAYVKRLNIEKEHLVT